MSPALSIFNASSSDLKHVNIVLESVPNLNAESKEIHANGRAVIERDFASSEPSQRMGCELKDPVAHWIMMLTM
jgi:hypothetical protein